VNISAAQLRALQALAARVFTGDSEEEKRQARLAWAAGQLGRNVVSFRALRGDEATRLIETLKASLGQALAPRRRPRSREAALAAATHGRRNFPVSVPVMAGPDDLARIDRARTEIGMTPEGLSAWLASKTSPIGARSDGRIRTLADANKIVWALRAMARRAG
jgi:hypothetical protein